MDSSLSDLLHLGVRFYEPGVGRFSQVDPAREGVNWYVYVDAMPTLMVDPAGLWIFTCPGHGTRVRKWWWIGNQIIRMYWCYGCQIACEDRCLKDAGEHCWSDDKYDKCLDACSEAYQRCLRNLKRRDFEASF